MNAWNIWQWLGFFYLATFIYHWGYAFPWTMHYKVEDLDDSGEIVFAYIASALGSAAASVGLVFSVYLVIIHPEMEKWSLLPGCEKRRPGERKRKALR